MIEYRKPETLMMVLVCDKSAHCYPPLVGMPGGTEADLLRLARSLGWETNTEDGDVCCPVAKRQESIVYEPLRSV